MFLRTFAILLFCSASFYLNVSVSGTALNSSELETEQPQPQSLAYLGNVGTKQFFVDSQLATWQESIGTCYTAGLTLATIKNEAEWNFLREQLMVFHTGPFWLGGRDIGNKSMFRWSQSYASPEPNDPETMLGTFIYYYNYVEQGPLALQMNENVGPAVFAAHSFVSSAKALCQSLSSPPICIDEHN